MNKEVKVVIGIGVVVVALGIFLFARQPKVVEPVSQSAQQVLSKPGGHRLGNENAKVTVIEFGDYQCPACAQSAPIVEKVLEAYRQNPQFSFVFKNYPLPQHANAMVSAEVAEAAGEQGKYWEMYPLLYAHQNDWAGQSDPLSLFKTYAQQLGLDVQKFADAVQAKKFEPQILQDKADGNAVNVQGTPTFFINGVPQSGIGSFDDFKQRIDAALSK